MPHLELVAIVVEEYDPAIAFFVDVLGFDLVEDSPARTNASDRKRALALNAKALTTARELGMRKVAADCERLLASLI